MSFYTRPTSVTEPESGTTTYGYAYNGTGLVVTRKRPKANQPSTSVLTTTTTQYDSLGRVLSVNYDDNLTPSKGYTYDANPPQTWGGHTGTNVKGRLVYMGAEVGSNSATHSGQLFSYDPMGRIIATWECGPTSCDNGNQGTFGMSYTYDLAGNLKTSTDVGGTTSTYTFSLANEVLSLTSSLSNSTNPANVLSNVQNGPNGPLTLSLGNGLTDVRTYDALGRQNGGYVCNGSSSTSCAGGTQVYGFATTWNGIRDTWDCDTAMNQCFLYGYDDFNRLASRTVNQGTTQNFTYSYDRYGNRWYQTATAGSGPQPSYSFNLANNQITTSGYAYDAAGNMINDGTHTYTYDAEGKTLSVDNGATGQYVYNAFDQRVQTVSNGTTLEYFYNANGQRDSIWAWNGSSNTQIQGQYYWGAKHVAFYKNGQIHFQHQDWIGSERMRTGYNGTAEGSFSNLPFGDGQATISGSDLDPYHFAMLDYDAESTTDHAQYRQYNPAQGRWMRPDPYMGSYDFSNPQSMNRYAYVLNNPMSATDPLGQDCIYPADTIPPSWAYGDITLANGITIRPGDCSSDDDDGYFVDASGVTAASIDPETDGLTGYSIGNQLYNPDGTTFNADFTGYGSGISDSTNNFLGTINSMYQTNLFDASDFPNLNAPEPNSAANNGHVYNTQAVKFGINVALQSYFGPLPSCHTLDNIGDGLEWGGTGILATAGVAAVIPGGQVYAGFGGAVGGVVVFGGVTADKASKHGIGCWQ